ncbi:MAG: DNA replication and repair protein RecF [Bdellovibrionaceae bacterium]|nr:DNA replication and repair protein RecF [Pseudobdellovibrionaceae bacterium]MDW8189343.1 DNA replication and repair protein RecF [Pseudobdellovibrionaceae bacterium]
MPLTDLKLISYRNYINSHFTFNEKFNLIIGENAVGKTNLVEAIYLLLNGMFLRELQIDDVVSFSHTHAYIEGHVNCGNYTISYDVTIDRNRRTKNHRKNGKRVNIDELLEDNSVVTFVPEHLSSVKMGSEYRRMLTDHSLISLNKDNQILIREYKKALVHRNKILKNFVEGLQTKEQTEQLLKAINPLFIKYSTLLTVRRIHFLALIEPMMNQVLDQFFQGSDFLQIYYIISSQRVSFDTSYDQLYQKVEGYHWERWQQLREAELRVGYSLFGAHRHDIEFYFNEKNAKTHCSQGQQRLIILSFKMAQMTLLKQTRNGDFYLILDDVLSELDLKNQSVFLEFLVQLPSQVFMTETHDHHQWKPQCIKKEFYLRHNHLNFKETS